MGCCRNTVKTFARAQVREPAPTSPCLGLETAGDTVLVEILGSGTMIPKAPYSGIMSMTRTMSVLGCQGTRAHGLVELELAVTEALTSPQRAAKFWARLQGRLVSVGAVKAALVASA